jgi:hypothetical protein
MWRSAEPGSGRWRRLPAILYNGGQVLDFTEDRILYERRLPGGGARVRWP